MDEEERKFESIGGGLRSVSRSLSRSRARSRSTSRSLRSRRSRRQSLSRVYSAQAFDDHYGAYSPPPSPQAERVGTAPTEDSSTSTNIPSDAEKDENRDLEKQETEELAEPELEVQYGIENDRDFQSDGEKDGDLARTRTGRSLKRDPTVVDWDNADDPLNPKNWSMKRKWAATFVVSAFTFISPVSSSMVAPALSKVAAEFDISNETEIALVLSIFVLAYAIGPLFLVRSWPIASGVVRLTNFQGPLSEVYGRVRVIQLSNLFFLAWNIGCGFAQTEGQMMAFRFLSGLGGSAPLAIGGGVLSDIWTADQRGKAIGIYSLMPLLGKSPLFELRARLMTSLGPAVGPMAGGFIALKTTWRWCFWSTSILTGVIQVFGFFYLQESYAPTLLRKKAARLRQETGNEKLHTSYDSEKKISKLLAVALVRPFRLLGTQIIIQFIALYMAYLYGLMYLLLSTFPTLWESVYHESSGIGGLNYISLGLGFFLGTQITAPLNDRLYMRLKKRNNGVGKPEFRVPLMFVGSLFIPMGLFWYVS
jgi:MFS family permease